MRETRIIKTPAGGHKVEIKTYIVGREVEQLDEIIYKQLKVGMTGNNTPNIDMNTSFLTEQTHKLIEIMVVAVDDKKEGALNTVLDMRKDDYLFIISELKKVTEGGDLEERKKKV